MKIVHFTHNLIDGAGRASYQIHKALLKEGIDSLMLVAKKDVYDNTVLQVVQNSKNINTKKPSKKILLLEGLHFIYFLFNQILWYLALSKWKPTCLFNVNHSYVSIRKLKKHLTNCNVICLYSIQSFLSSKIIRDIQCYTNAPIVWIPMDMEPITGGCHFTNKCDKYQNTCGDCPQLKKSKKNDISRLTLNKKRTHFINLPITIVASTSLMSKYVRNSTLFKNNRIETRLLAVDNTIFKPFDKKIARDVLNLPKDKKLILFSCFNMDDERKGADYLITSLRLLNIKIKEEKTIINNKDIHLVTIGRKKGLKQEDLPFPNVHYELLNDDRILALMYNAVDVIAVPSKDDIGPMIINEAFLCETPIVSFDVGVARDILIYDQSSYLIKQYDLKSFSNALYKCLINQKSKNKGNLCNMKKQLSIKHQAKGYISLFRDLLTK